MPIPQKERLLISILQLPAIYPLIITKSSNMYPLILLAIVLIADDVNLLQLPEPSLAFA